MKNWENKMSTEIDKTFAESRKSLEEAYEAVKSVRIEMQTLLNKKGIEISKPQLDQRFQPASLIFDSVPLRKKRSVHEISIQVPAFSMQ